MKTAAWVVGGIVGLGIVAFATYATYIVIIRQDYKPNYGAR